MARTNSPLDNSLLSTKVPEPKVEPKEESDFRKLAHDKQWPQIYDALEARKEYWRKYLPGNSPKELSDAEIVSHYRLAVAVIAEIEGLQNIVERNK